MNQPGIYPTQRIGTRDDYVQLAELSDRYRVAFETLAERFEADKMEIAEIRQRLEVKGFARAERAARPTNITIEPDEVWITTIQAEWLVPDINKFCSRASPSLRRRLRQPWAKGARGTGYLWHREDVERVAEIRKVCGVSPRAALIAFEKMRMALPRADEWLTSQEARSLIPSICSAARKHKGAIECRNKTGARWYKRDVLMVKRLVDTGVGVASAFRILAAWNRGLLLKSPESPSRASV